MSCFFQSIRRKIILRDLQIQIYRDTERYIYREREYTHIRQEHVMGRVFERFVLEIGR